MADLKASKKFVNIDKITEGGSISSLFQDIEPPERRKEWRRSQFRHATVVDEYWGRMVDENGDIVMNDCLAVKAGKTIIRRPIINPIWSVEPTNGRRRWPLVAFSPFTHPLRFEGRGILKQAWGLALFYENVFNLSSDGLTFSIFSGLQGDMSRLVDPTDTKLRPGRFWGMKAGTTGKVLEAVQSGTIDVNALLAYMQNVDQIYQNNSFVSDLVIGLPGYRSDITKGEVQIKTAQALGIFDRMGRSIELGGRQTVQLIFDLLVQFTDETTMPVIGDALPEPVLAALVNATPIERWKMIRSDMRATFTGVTQALQRDQQLGRGMQVAALLDKPIFAQAIKNPNDFLKSLIDLLGWGGKIDINDMPLGPPGGAVPGGGISPEALMAGGGGPPMPEAPRAPTVASIVRNPTRGGGPSFALDKRG
jgi:hypothetical protein